MDNKATKIFKEFIILYCFYLRKQNEDLEPTEFTLSLETFTPHNKLCHQKYIGDMGPLLRALGKELKIPSDEKETKESIFREIWLTLMKMMESFLEQFLEDDKRFDQIINGAFTDLVQNATARTSAKNHLQRLVDEHHLKIGPDSTESRAIFKLMMDNCRKHSPPWTY